MTLTENRAWMHCQLDFRDYFVNLTKCKRKSALFQLQDGVRRAGALQACRHSLFRYIFGLFSLQRLSACVARGCGPTWADYDAREQKGPK